jgi:hypothetical protein
MHGRIDNPALTVPGALKPLQELAGAARQADIPETTLYLVELRASQINGLRRLRRHPLPRAQARG